MADIGARATVALGQRLQRQIEDRFAAFPDMAVVLTGDAYVGSRGLDAILTDLRGSLGLALVVIFEVLRPQLS